MIGRTTNNTHEWDIPNGTPKYSKLCGLFLNYSNKLAHYSIEYPEYDGSIMAGGWLYHITHRIY